MAQILVPVQDQAAGAWTATPLWSKVDDDSTVNPSGDGVTIASEDNTSPSNADLQLAAGVDPGIHTGHIIRARWRKSASGGHAITAVAELWLGIPGTGTLITTMSAFNISDVEFETTLALSTGQASSINDYSNLYIRLSRQGDTGGSPAGRRSLVVDLVELEVPDAPTQIQLGGTISPAGAVTPVGFPAAYTKYYPIADVVTGGWTTAPLWSKVDEDPTNSAADSDVIANPPSDQGGGDPVVFDLPNIATPETWYGWRIRVRARINSAGRTRTLAAYLRQGSTGFRISALGFQTLDSTTYQWFEFPVFWDIGNYHNLLNQTPDLLTDLQLGLDPGGSEFFVSVNVSAVELLVPFGDAHPFGTPSWSDVVTPKGRSGPYLLPDGNYYALGLDHAEKIPWLFKGTAPSDGHDPTDWTRVCPVGEFAWFAGSPNSPIQPSDRQELREFDMIKTEGDDLMIIGHTTVEFRGVCMLIDPTQGSFGQIKGISPRIVNGDPDPTNPGNDFLRIREHPTVPDDFLFSEDTLGTTTGDAALGFQNQLHATEAGGNYTTSTFIELAPHSLFDYILANGNMHFFFGKTDGALDDGVRVVTVSIGKPGTTGTRPTADFLTEDHHRSGVGAAYSNGTVWRVVSAYPQTDGGGISAITFDSSHPDPTKSIEIVTTRNAYKAAYELSVVAIPFGVGTNTKMVVFWIDAAADSIRAAFRNDGESTWTDLGDLVAGSVGRTRLSVWRVDNDTAAILVDGAGTGIEFYTVDLAFGGGGTTFQESMGGTVTPSAAHLSKPAKTLSAFILNQPSGSLTPLAKKLLAGTVTPTGVHRTPIQIALAGLINLAGTVSNTLGTIARSFSGVLNLAADVSRETSKRLAGTITPASTLRHGVANLLEATITPTATATSRILTTLAGVITPTGVSDHQLESGFFQRTFTGALTTTGALLHRTAHSLDASIAPDGAVTRYIATVRGGSIAPAGAFGPITVGKIFSSNVTPASTVSRYIAHLVAGSIEPASTLTGRVATALGGLLTSAGSLANVVNPGGFSIALSGTLTLAGERLTRIGQTLEGAMVPTSTVTKASTRLIDGVITPASTVLKALTSTYSGTLTPAGVVSTVRGAILAVSGAINASGDVIKATSRSFASTITTEGALRRRISLSFASTLTLAGAATKKTRRILSATITLTSTIVTRVFNVLAPPISRLIRGQGRGRRIHHQGRSNIP